MHRVSLVGVRTARSRGGAIAAAAILAACLAGCADAPVASPQGTAAPAGAATVDGPSDRDVAYVTAMLPHHEQGLALTAMADRWAVSPALRQVAFIMDNEHVEELGQLQGLLATWGRPSTTASPDDRMRAAMGMASDPQLAALDRERGGAFDRDWIAVMTRHHQGAVDMSRDILADSRNPSVRNLAQGLLAVQPRQIAAMRAIAASA